MFEGVEDLEGFKNAMEGKGMMGGEGEWGHKEEMDPEMKGKFEDMMEEFKNSFPEDGSVIPSKEEMMNFVKDRFRDASTNEVP